MIVLPAAAHNFLFVLNILTDKEKPLTEVNQISDLSLVKRNALSNVLFVTLLSLEHCEFSKIKTPLNFG